MSSPITEEEFNLSEKIFYDMDRGWKNNFERRKK